jgi:hypothetical protein
MIDDGDTECKGWVLGERGDKIEVVEIGGYVCG